MSPPPNERKKHSQYCGLFPDISFPSLSWENHHPGCMAVLSCFFKKIVILSCKYVSLKTILFDFELYYKHGILVFNSTWFIIQHEDACCLCIHFLCCIVFFYMSMPSFFLLIDIAFFPGFFSYYKQCFYEHYGACLFTYICKDSFRVYTWKFSHWVIGYVFVYLYKIMSNWFVKEVVSVFTSNSHL